MVLSGFKISLFLSISLMIAGVFSESNEEMLSEFLSEVLSSCFLKAEICRLHRLIKLSYSFSEIRFSFKSS